MQEYKERYRTYEQIKRSGAIGNLNETLEIITHDIRTRLIAWPGNGFQTQSIHMFIVAPGQTTTLYTYQTSEEALVCLRGSGQIFLHDQWITINPGDIAYFPEGVTHAFVNPENNIHDFILISQITPPVLELYEPAGFYDIQKCVMKHDSIMHAKKNIILYDLSMQGEVAFNTTYPSIRAWNLTPDIIRKHGALFNMFHGAQFTQLNLPMRLVLWPGFGTRTAGFHGGYQPVNNVSMLHTHPISDEVLMLMKGTQGRYYCGDRWIPAGINDYLLAPCGVTHGASGPENDNGDPLNVVIGGGFASPPQTDLYLRAGCYQRGMYSNLPSVELKL